jgi:hypothetical protein
MGFIGVYISPWKKREKATYPFLASIYTGDGMAPWAIKSTENLPTLTST